MKKPTDSLSQAWSELDPIVKGLLLLLALFVSACPCSLVAVLAPTARRLLPRPTTPPSVTRLPTRTPTATPTRTPIPPTPTPMATLSTTARGIGVSRPEMMAVFGKKGSGFTFETLTDVSGLARIVGTFEFDLIIVEFIGPGDELVQASLHIVPSEEYPGFGAAQALYLISFLQLALPDWEGAATWVRDNMRQAWEEGEVRTARGGVQFTLRATTEPDTITVIVAGRR